MLLEGSTIDSSQVILIQLPNGWKMIQETEEELVAEEVMDQSVDSTDFSTKLKLTGTLPIQASRE